MTLKQAQQEKKALRNSLRDIRERLAKDRNACAQLCGTFLDSGLLKSSDCLSAYWPIGSEINVRPIMQAVVENDQVCGLPVVIGPDMALRFREWQPGLELEDGPFGVSQPGRTAPLMEPTVMLVPMLGFTQSGCRLGYGGGYYDRTLFAYRDQGKPVCAVGVAFDAQELDEIPTGRFDQRLDWIVTPSRVINCADHSD